MKECTRPECGGSRIAPSLAPASRGPAGDQEVAGTPLFFIVDGADRDHG